MERTRIRDTNHPLFGRLRKLFGKSFLPPIQPKINKNVILSNDDDWDAIAKDEPNESDWKNILLKVLQNIDPAAFERLSQRILRESGFVQAEVTGKSGDGGIDGKGIVRLNGLLNFHVFFQCKRFRDLVASSYIRDFREVMQGRSDKSWFITTGKFMRDAIKEAARDGASPIDLRWGYAV